MDRVTFKATLVDESDAGTFEAILSAPTLDRDNEVIDPKAFAPLPSVIPIHRDHDMTTRGLCASAEPYYAADGTLRAKGSFFDDSDGQRMRLYAKSGVLSMSVGFMSAKREMRDGAVHIVSAELLEASFVSVPSNREAAITGVKGVRPDGEKTVSGSYEALAEELGEALRSINSYAHVRATFGDYVVFVGYDENYNRTTMRAAWSRAEDGTLTLGTPEPVKVAEVIVEPTKSVTLPALGAPEGATGSVEGIDWDSAISDIMEVSR